MLCEPMQTQNIAFEDKFSVKGSDGIETLLMAACRGV
jgi:hypothetical protein